MSKELIQIRGAKIHNLKSVNVDIPKDKLVVITGVSGSGKSSLAFDTLYAEGQRRYVESLSSYARQFLGIMRKPPVEKIEGISPAISIDQRKAAHNPRSTVGTTTEIYDYLRLLFARIGVPHCPNCGEEISQQTIDQITEQILALPSKSKIVILGPVIRGRKGEYRGVLEEIQRSGFIRARIDGIIYRIEEALGLQLSRYKEHNIEVVVDRLVLDEEIDRIRLVDSLETALKLGNGVVIIGVSEGLDPSLIQEGKVKKSENGKGASELIFSEHFACEKCGVSLPPLEPRFFSFNSPYGACPACQGLGERLEIDQERVLPNKELTIAEGAIFPWAHASHRVGRQSYFWKLLKKLAKEHDFSLHTPIKELPKKVIDVILHGNDDFPGVGPWLDKRYHGTDSKYTRKEIRKYMVKKKCKACKGKRLKPEALAVTVGGRPINYLVFLPIKDARDFFKELIGKKSPLKKDQLKIAKPIIKEIISRLQFLVDVGLDYLTLDRKASTLAGGEEERIRLATQIGSQLTGVLYILDEPSIGLHPRDQNRLIKTLKSLRDLGNSVLVVEHDPQTIKEADWVIDVGPGAGQNGGKIVFEGTPKQLKKSATLTGEYFSGKKKVKIAKPSGKKKKSAKKSLVIKDASEHNLKGIDVEIPLAKFVCVTGVSGSGKSSLVNDILARALMKKFYNSRRNPGKHDKIVGARNLDKVVLIDQSPIGRTPRSNPATYTGVFDYIRDLFAQTKEAKKRGYDAGRFSFNVKGGRCEKCGGQGQNKIEMYFLPDIYVECSECKGKRFNQETLAVTYKGKSIADTLEMTVEEALKFFKNIPGLSHKLKILKDVGLGYIELGQPSPALSGGEAQRIKLAKELSKKATGSTLYILDEPTTGLHPHDISKLVLVLRKLVDKGNTVLVIEHNLDVVKNADWIVDLGPEGGREGGEIVATGTPEKVSQSKKSYTGQYLKKLLSGKKASS